MTILNISEHRNIDLRYYNDELAKKSKEAKTEIAKWKKVMGIKIAPICSTRNQYRVVVLSLASGQNIYPTAQKKTERLNKA